MEGRSLIRSLVDRIDDTVDAWFDPLRGRPGADRIAYLASELADYSIGWHILNAATTLVTPRLDRVALAGTARMATALGVESAIVNGAIKPLFKRPRPDGWAEVASLSPRRPKTASFPSGHASSATVAALLLTERIPVLAPVWWGAAGMVAASRIYTRMHHFSDVMAGVATGAIIGVAATRLWPLEGTDLRPVRR